MLSKSDIQSALQKHKNIFSQLGVGDDSLAKIADYVDLLWTSNEELNLISRKMTLDELVENHVIDCLLALPYFPKTVKKVADFGSGGGLPAVIYAICFPDVEFHLYEKSPKKQDFLKKCIYLNPKMKIFGEIKPDFQGYDLVTARGFKPIDVILDVSRKYESQKGSYFLLKGRKEKIDEELQLAQKKFKSLKFDVIELKSPVLDVERNLVTIHL